MKSISELAQEISRTEVGAVQLQEMPRANEAVNIDSVAGFVIEGEHGVIIVERASHADDGDLQQFLIKYLDRKSDDKVDLIGALFGLDSFEKFFTTLMKRPKQEAHGD